MTTTAWISIAIAAAAAAVLGWILGGRSGRASLMRSVEEVADPDSEGGGPEARQIRALLTEHWVRKGTERAKAREEAVRDALDRLAAFLHEAVERPLVQAAESDDAAQRQRGVQEALVAVRDLDFFLEDLPSETRSEDLIRVVREVSREFAGSWEEKTIRFKAPAGTLKARMHPEGLKDALYLLLHNAARFGGKESIEVRIEPDGPPRVVVADRGSGFTAEALVKAYDPFYSTAADGLGLGLPQAKRILDAMGAVLELKNRDDGGAEVTVTLPAG